MNTKINEISAYLENIALLLLGIFFLAFPLVVATFTTEPFALPKQILLAGTSLIALFLFGGKMISDGKVLIRKTPFDLPIFLFGLMVFISSLLAVNRYDSLITFVPLLFTILIYFVIVTLVKTKSSISFLLASLTVGACILSLLTALSVFKVYILPFDFTKVQTFTPLGSLLDQIIYLALVLPVAVYFALPLTKLKTISEFKNLTTQTIGFAIGTVIIIAGLLATIYGLFVLQKPVLLPFETGFQTAFAAISQDAGRVAQGFFFGSGFGTYVTDFTRFKAPAFNLNQDLWSFTFFRSSSLMLELLATTGVAGVGALLLLIVKVLRIKNREKAMKENAVYVALILAVILTFILPFSFITQTLLFLLLGLFAASQGLIDTHKYYDIELSFTAFKYGLIPLSTSPFGENVHETKAEHSLSKFLPVTFFVLFTGVSAVIGFFIINFVTSDVTFQNSLVAASSNNGMQTYNEQVNAIKVFPYRDSYHRIYSQTNLALANSLASQQPKGSSPSAQVQQTISTLIQQSINAARSAVSISPHNVVNWNNLSSVYRSLIGFGENADAFAITTAQQAIALDPNNPQGYINLGGIYFQLGKWEDAQRQFQVAINLKPDFANAYYNLGHALENKGDLQGALQQYQAVKSLTPNDKENQKRISAEIEAIEKKIGSSAEQNKEQGSALQNQPQNQQSSALQNQPDLGVNEPSTQLPEQKQKIELPAPSVTPPSPTPTPNAAESATPTTAAPSAPVPTANP